MHAAAVESTTVATVAYDASRELLQIEFRDRTVYRYFGVPAEVHDALMRAHSKGRCFNSLIRGHFDYSLVPNAPSAPS
jgi:hypothetical protein